jgi:hypothetical protein
MKAEAVHPLDACGPGSSRRSDKSVGLLVVGVGREVSHRRRYHGLERVRHRIVQLHHEAAEFPPARRAISITAPGQNAPPPYPAGPRLQEDTDLNKSRAMDASSPASPLWQRMLDQGDLMAKMPPVAVPRMLPVVLSWDEAARPISAARA